MEKLDTPSVVIEGGCEAALSAEHTVIDGIRPKAITVDAHVDIPWIQTKIGYFKLSENNEGRFSEVDFPRMRKGGLQCAIFALYLSDQMQDELGKSESLNYICRQVAFLERQKGMVLVDSPEVALDAVQVGVVPIFLGLEGGRLINNDATMLARFRQLGVRYLTVTHNKNTDWADSATDLPKHKGLTEQGKIFVRAANRHGILMDVSHGSEQTAWQVIAECTLPPIASHSGCKELRNHSRNLEDALIKAIAKKKGVVCVPFAKRFIGPTWRCVVDHIDHVVQTQGSTSYVGVGSDFDGCELASGIEDVSDWKKVVIDELDARGFTESCIEQIAGGNVLRVLGEGLKI